MSPAPLFAVAPLLLSLGCGPSEGSPLRDAGGPSPDARVQDASAIDAPTVETDAGAPETDAGLLDCEFPALACPPEAPLAGGACEGALSCEYVHPEAGEGDEWSFTCVDGAWDERLVCGANPCAPPLAERCREPFAGMLEGVGVEIGPAEGGAFRPFASGERLTAVLGPQGLAMVSLRLRLDSITAPRCVLVRVTPSLDGVPGDLSELPVTLRCGESERVLTILGSNPCEARDYALLLEVEVAGVGRDTASLVVTGGCG